MTKGFRNLSPDIVAALSLPPALVRGLELPAAFAAELERIAVVARHRPLPDRLRRELAATLTWILHNPSGEAVRSAQAFIDRELGAGWRGRGRR